MPLMPPFPPSGKFLKCIRQSSHLLRQSANISINPSSVERLLASPAFTSSFNHVATNHGLSFPLKFPSPFAELNLLCILSLLNFGSGYRLALHAETGRGTWDSIRAFVFSLYLASSAGDDDLLSARGMRNIHHAKVAELMNVNIHVERQHETIPGILVGELGGPMHELVKLIVGTLNETGEVLDNLGYPNLGSFVAETLKEGERAQSGGDVDAQVDVILDRLVRAIPAFRDMAVVNDQPIYCFKKALFLIHALNVRFGSISPPPFPIPSTTHIPVFADNVLPSLLIHLGVIDLSASTSLSRFFPGVSSSEKLASLLAAGPDISSNLKSEPKTAPKEGPILTLDQAYILRAAAIDACELIIEVARSLDLSSLSSHEVSLEWIKEVTLPELDMWIRAVAKDRPDYRKLERFVLRNTTFF